MKEGVPYPRSGVLRDNKAELDAHAERLLSGDVPGHMFEQYIDGVKLTEDEREDVQNFVEHSTSRLSAGALSSPNAPGYRQHGPVRDKLDKHADLAGHDHWHSAIRYLLSGGKSLVPKYMEAATDFDQYTDPEAIAEESIVEIFDNRRTTRRILEAMAPGKNPDESIPELVKNLAGEDHEYYLERFSRIRGLLDTDRAAYFAQAHVILDSGIRVMDASGRKSNIPVRESRRAVIEARRNEILDDPNAEHMRVAKAYYESIRGENKDPRFLINEFRRMLAPLLTRLRFTKVVEKAAKLGA